MLTNLIISNIVLIDKLNLEFTKGLNVLTGETGAGKSILMDALNLALGERGDTSLIRHGCENASVTAEFDSINDNIANILNEVGIEYDDNVVLRRVIGADGKGRAWVNDVPVSIKTLKSIGEELVEIHGQFANHSLLNPSMHRVTLDNFAIKTIEGFSEILNSTRKTYLEYNSARKELSRIRDLLARSAEEREYLEHNVAELKSLNVLSGEENELATKRTDMMNAEKNAAILNEVNQLLGQGGNSLESQIFSIAHVLERVKTNPNPYSQQIDRLYQVAEVISEITQDLLPEELDTDTLDLVEERLFAIRAAARKHHVTADELPNKLIEMENQLNTINNSDNELKKLENLTIATEKIYYTNAKKLTEMRKIAANNLRTKISGELPDLKLNGADFIAEITTNTDIASVNGCDDIVFMIKTNPGMPFAPLHKAASGGELARFMLALRAVLSDKQSSHTFVFDEVDTGISGATASAVGERLNRLAAESQAIVITHSAQVAGYADKHFKIEKTSKNNITTTHVSEITGDNRLNEIARIISGAEITPESLASAKTLLK